jgi:eukaryotic-like serine/threonine-protein kinase
MPLWNEIEGEILDDNLPLQKLLRSEGRTAWFATTGADGQPAVVSVFEALNDEDTALARVQTAARVEHPNLLIIRRTGSTRIGGDPYVYAVMEPFDQTLAEVLRERPLTPEETREVTESLLSALETVEGAGLYHGHVDSAGVLGVGDSIKLRSDCLTQRHGDSSDAPALAALVYNALTGRRFSSERDALQLPAPFATLVRAGAGAGSNGSLAAMRRVLSGPAVTSAEAAAVAPSAANPPIPVRSSAAPATAPATPRTPAHTAATPRAALKEDDAGSRRRKRPGIAIAAIVLMAIALVAFWYATKQPTRHTPISGEAASAPNPQQAAPAAVPPAATPTGDAAATGAPETAKSAPKPEARAAARPAPTNPATDAAPTGGERSVWHVVAYTYSYESAAQRKATELAAQYPKLEPQVFSPTGHAPFLVTLGGGTNRQDAFARRDAARTAGMPSDTYAMNFRK